MQMPTSVSTRLQYQHKTLLDLIEDLTDEQIRQAIVPGKWSIFEQIVHLETYQHCVISRIRQLLDQDNPAFDVYMAESDPLFHDHCGLSSREVIQDLLTTRKELASGILNFTEADLARTAVHPVYGKMNLVQWLHFFLLHEAHHLFSIFKLAALIRNR